MYSLICTLSIGRTRTMGSMSTSSATGSSWQCTNLSLLLLCYYENLELLYLRNTYAKFGIQVNLRLNSSDSETSDGVRWQRRLLSHHWTPLEYTMKQIYQANPYECLQPNTSHTHTRTHTHTLSLSLSLSLSLFYALREYPFAKEPILRLGTRIYSVPFLRVYQMFMAYS